MIITNSLSEQADSISHEPAPETCSRISIKSFGCVMSSPARSLCFVVISLSSRGLAT
jgi:hypothetical protein